MSCSRHSLFGVRNDAFSASLRAARRRAVAPWRLAAAIAGVFAIGAVSADEKYWNNSNGGDWGTASNWDGGVPGKDDTAIFALGGSYVVTVKGSYEARTIETEGRLTLRIRQDNGQASLKLADGFINEGTIELGRKDSPHQAQLEITNGSLVNAAGATLNTYAGQSYPYLYVQLDNQGTFNIDTASDYYCYLYKPTAQHANSGTIHVMSGKLYMQQGGTSPSFTNTGTIDVATGGTFEVQSGKFNYDGGAISGAGTLSLSSVELNLGQDFSNDVVVFRMSGGSVNGPGSLTNATGLTLSNGTKLNAELINQANLTIEGSGNEINGAFNGVPTGTTLRIVPPSGNTAYLKVKDGFTNEGTIELGRKDSPHQAQLEIANGSLVNAAGATLKAFADQTYPYLYVQLDNQGTFNVDVESGYYCYLYKPSAQHANSGTIHVESGKLYVQQSGTSPSFTNTGTIDVASGATLEVSGGKFYQDAGLFRLASGPFSTSGSQPVVEVRGGEFAMNGKLTGGLLNSNGRVRPGDGPGMLEITGDYTQQGGGTLEIEIGGTTRGSEYDWLSVGGKLSLAGAIEITPFGDFEPVQGEVYQSLTSGGSRTGQFDAVVPVDMPLSVDVQTNYGSKGVEIEILGNAKFRAEIREPGNNQRFLGGTLLKFDSADLNGEPPVTYSWTSDRDSVLSTEPAFEASGLSVGKHQITLHAEDGNGDLAEDQITLTVYLKPNLVAMDVGGPTRGFDGDDVEVHWRVRNTGVHEAGGGWSDRVYLSTNTTLDGGDALVGTFTRTDSLAPGIEYTRVEKLTLPIGRLGTFYLLIKADAENAIDEPDGGEGDNLRAADRTIRIEHREFPDLVVAKLTVPDSVYETAQLILGWSGANDGDGATFEPWSDRVYLSDDDALDLGGEAPDLLLRTEPVAETVPSEGNYDRSFTFEAPQVAGTYHVFVVQDTANAITEISEDNNTAVAPLVVLAPEYFATIRADRDTGVAGEVVGLSGVALDRITQIPVGNVPVKLRVNLRGTRRTFEATTDESGSYAFALETEPGEAGRYTLAADHPAVREDHVQDEFTLYGLRASPAELSGTLVPGVEIEQALVLENLGDVALNGLNTEIRGLPDNISFSAEPPSKLEPRESRQMVYRLLAKDDSTRSAEAALHVTSVEGAAFDVALDLTVLEQKAILEVAPTRLDAAMVRGEVSYVTCTLRNAGGRATEPIRVSIPNAEWLSLTTPGTMEPLGPGEEAAIELRLTPSDSLALGPYKGNIRVGSGSLVVQLPFEFTCVSSGFGDLEITVTDEFTYYGEGNPPVAGATVRLIDAFDKSELDQQVTEETGLAVWRDLRAGPYEIEVSAPEHGSFRGTIEVRVGQSREVEAFLPRQLVRYTWYVEPVFFEDRYEIHVEATFETNVPAPVVTIDPPIVDLDQLVQPGETKTIEFTLTNHGLIRAEDVRLQLTDAGDYTLEGLDDALGDLEAKSSITFPVQVTRAALRSEPSCLIPRLVTIYVFVCGIEREYTVPVFFVNPGAHCKPPVGTDWECLDCEREIEIIYRGGGNGECPWWDCDCRHDHEWCKDGDIISGPPPWLERFAYALCNCLPCIEQIHSMSKRLDKIRRDLRRINRRCKPCPPSNDRSRNLRCALGFVGCATSSLSIFQDFKDLFAKCRECYYDNVDLKDPFQLIIYDSDDPTVVYFTTHANRFISMNGYFAQPYGDSEWLSMGADSDNLDRGDSLIQQFVTKLEPESEDGERISETEKSALLSLERPDPITQEHVSRLIARLNRTQDYWDAGIYSSEDVPEGWSTDFVDYNRFEAARSATEAADAASSAEGFESIEDGLLYAADVLYADKSEEKEGVCAQVRIRIDQSAVVTRSGFRANLGLDNLSGDVTLESVLVELMIQDVDGNDATDRFDIRPPLLTGLSDMDGGGSLAPGETGTAQWLIIAGDAAAPDEPTVYFLRGRLAYEQEGESVEVPLFPTAIIAVPNASLELKYFLEQRVYSDDPFTDEVEPSIPYSLGLLVHNAGTGPARDMTITSAQPKIIENEKGLLINFRIVGTQVGAEKRNPSLTAELGDVDPTETVAARWLMKTSLEGEFVEYDATFEHVNGLNEPEFSILDEISIHPTTHVVRVDLPADDGLPDFLAIDKPNKEDFPNHIHGSDWQVLDVAAETGATHNGPPRDDDLTIEFRTTLAAGWTYVRVPDPADARYRIVAASRSDGRVIRVPDNAWQTSRIIRLKNEDPRPERLLHLLDYSESGGSATYTLVFDKLILTGDMDCDKDIGFDDIDGFVAAMIGRANYEDAYPDCNFLNADCDENGDVNFDDIDWFVLLLSP